MSRRVHLGLMTTRVFTALDLPDADSAWRLFQELQPVNPYFKVGLELYAAAGPDFVRRLVGEGGEIFLDLKFHDIPNTVAKAVRQASQLGVRMLNVHATGGQKMIAAAAREINPQRTLLIGVTVLTSFAESDLAESGIAGTVLERVLQLAKQSQEWGLHGVVASAHELGAIRAACGEEFVTVVPGIRPQGAASHDQSRTMTPAEAAKAGAHYIVVGRPILEAAEPRVALEGILGEL